MSFVDNQKFRSSVLFLQRSISLKFILGQKKFWDWKKNWVGKNFCSKKKTLRLKNILCPKNLRSKICFWTDKILGPNKILVSRKIFGQKRILVPTKILGMKKKFWSEKMLCLKRMLGQKKILEHKFSLVQKKIWVKKKFCSQKKFWYKKILGLKKIWFKKNFWVTNRNLVCSVIVDFGGVLLVVLVLLVTWTPNPLNSAKSPWVVYESKELSGNNHAGVISN